MRGPTPILFLAAAVVTTLAPAAELWSSHHTGGIEYATAARVACDGGVFLSISREGTGPLIGRLDDSGNMLWGVRFDETYDEAYDLAQTSDGGVVGCGRFFLMNNEDLWVVRFDSRGSLVWSRRYGGPALDRGSRIAPLADGGFLVAGRTSSFGAGGSDVWLLRLDGSGDVIWQKTYGGPLEENIIGGFQVVADGGGIFTGRTTSFGSGNDDAWFVRVDAQGEIVWQFALGGPGADRTFGIDATGDGGFVTAGRTASAGAGSADAWVLRLDVDGRILWQETIGAAGFDSGEGIVVRADDTVVVLGYTESYPPPGQSSPGDFSLTGLDPSGAVLWHRIYGTAFTEQTGRMDAWPSGGVLWTGTAGMFPYAAWAARTDDVGLPSSCEPVRSVSPAVGASAFVPTSTSVVPGLSSAVPIPVTWQPVTYAFLATPACAGGRPGEVSPPLSQHPLFFETAERLRWEEPAPSGAQGFDLYRGDLASLSSGGGAVCLQSGVLQSTWVDPSTPAPCEGWFYLVRGVNPAGQGTLGFGSSCSARVPTVSCGVP